jgi:hypothetical protein
MKACKEEESDTQFNVKAPEKNYWGKALPITIG